MNPLRLDQLRYELETGLPASRELVAEIYVAYVKLLVLQERHLPEDEELQPPAEPRPTEKQFPNLPRAP